MFNSKICKIGVVFVSTLLLGSVFGQNRAFPYSLKVSYSHTIKPNHRTQAQLNSDVTSYYNTWKNEMLQTSSKTSGGYYIDTKGETEGITVSEAHGYGMVIFALMAGYDTDAQAIFDGMYKVFLAHPSIIDNDLMCWTLASGEISNQDAATDGDLDIAYALLLAYYQWGTTGTTYDYLTAAKTLISAIKRSEMSSSTKRTLQGDWDDNDYTTRTSDWMAGHMRAFSEATGDDFWNAAADTVYSLISQVRNSSTGLLPDFVKGSNPAKPDANAIENNGDRYGWNACRDPWRIATDFLHNNDADAKEELLMLANFITDKTSNDPSNIAAGYSLSGSGSGNGSPEGAFLSPFIAACIVDSQFQSYLNDGWDEMKNNDIGYFDNTITMGCMLLISGNWWNPIASQLPVLSDNKIDRDLFKSKNVEVSVKNGVLKVDNQLSFQNSNLAVYNLFGVRVKTISLNGVNNKSVFVDVNNLSSGKYIVKLIFRDIAINKTFTLIK